MTQRSIYLGVGYCWDADAGPHGAPERVRSSIRQPVCAPSHETARHNVVAAIKTLANQLELKLYGRQNGEVSSTASRF